MPDLVYLNGAILPLAEAMVPVDDRGFLFGDAVYEAMRSYDGRVWALKRHMRRLSRSLAAIEMGNVDVDKVEEAIEETFRANDIPDAFIYLQVTRGVAPRAHAFPRNLEPTVLVTVRDIIPKIAEISPRGVAAVTAPDLRWRRCDVKSTNLLPNVLAKTRAHERGAFEAILVDAEGYVTEGSSTSVFWVEDRRLFTTPLGPEVLPGISREFVIEIAQDEGIPLFVERTPIDRVRRAGEIFVAGTSIEALPITSLDDASVGNGRAGPLTRRLQDEFRRRVEAGDDAPR
jgi:D-alanine transaminase